MSGPESPTISTHEDMVPYLLEPEEEAECRLGQRLCMIDDCNLWVHLHRYAQFQFLDCGYHGTVLFSETAPTSEYRPGAPF